MSGTANLMRCVEGAEPGPLHLDPQQQSQTQQQQQGHQPNSPEVVIDIPLESLRSLYLPSTAPVNFGIGQLLRRGSTSITYKTVPLEFSPVTRLDPLQKKRILVTGVSFGAHRLHCFVRFFQRVCQ